MAFQRKILALVLAGGVAGSLVEATAAEDTPQPPKQKWSFSGPFGKYDQGQRNAAQGLSRGLPGLPRPRAGCSVWRAGRSGPAPAQAAAIAAEYQVKASPTTRARSRIVRAGPPTASRRRSQRSGGACPLQCRSARHVGDRQGARLRARLPVVAARHGDQYQEHGVDYIVALLTGYEDKAPAGINVPTGTFYNKYFPATRWPCRRRCRTSVDYTDGSPTTVDNTPRTFPLS